MGTAEWLTGCFSLVFSAKSGSSGLTYRADIDGLRAVAVLAVVLFHAGIAPFSGGFVGVDVFFVISGYLITGLIMKDAAGGRFSIGGFYERRIRRIFPALFATLFGVLAAGAVVLLPDDYFDLGNTAIGATFFAANFVFAKELGYFGSAAELSPLLHTWSLAVEEQFYIVYPLLLMLVVRRWAGRFGLVLWVLLLGSLAYSAWAVGAAPRAAFFLFPSRAWELLLGAVIAVGAVPVTERRELREAAGVLGLGLIGWSVFAFSEATPFPGTAALVPALGTGLVIAAGVGTTVARVLAWRPVVFVGLISYSLYLWHWPLLVLARQVVVTPHLPAGITAVVLAAALALAVLSWRFVEQPFRRGRFRGWPRARLFRTAGATMAAALVAGLAVTWGDGIPARLPADVMAIANARHDYSEEGRRCMVDKAAVAAGTLCDLGAGDGPPSFMVWGDSHAGALLPGLDAAARAVGRRGLFAGNSACPPLRGVDPPAADAPDCRAFNEAVLAAVAANDALETVVLAARWAIYAEGTRYGDETGPPMVLADGSDRDSRAVFAGGLERLVAALRAAGKDVVIVGPVPEVGRDVPTVLAKALLGVGAAGAADVAPSLAAFEARQAFVLPTLAALAADSGARLVWPHETLCRAGICAVEKLGRPLYSDDDHLAASAAVELATMFGQIFD